MVISRVLVFPMAGLELGCGDRAGSWLGEGSGTAGCADGVGEQT